MAVEALLDALERDAGAEALRIRAEGRNQAEATIARAAVEVDRRRAVARERITRERRAELARGTAEAARTLRVTVLQARAQLTDQVFLEARRQLTLLPPSRWAGQIPALLEEALRYLEPNSCLVECQSEGLPLIQAALRRMPEVRVESVAEALPGLIARSAEGDVVVDLTLVARLDRSREDLAIRLLQRVEGNDALG